MIYSEDFIVEIDNNNEPWFKVDENGSSYLYLDKWTLDQFGRGQEALFNKNIPNRLLKMYGFRKPSIEERRLWLSLLRLFGW